MSKEHQEWTNVCPATKCMQMSWIMSTSCLSDLRPLDNPFVALISRTASRLFPPLAGSKVSVSQQECTLTPPEGVQRGKSEGCGHAMRALREKMPNIMFLFSSKEIFYHQVIVALGW